jgi:predicted RND superfamily exporter protein
VNGVARWWTGIVGRHPVWVLGASLVVTVAMIGGLTRLTFDSSQDTMIPAGSTIASDNVRYQHQFGSDPMVLVFTGDVRTLLAGKNLTRLRALQHRLETHNSGWRRHRCSATGPPIE